MKYRIHAIEAIKKTFKKKNKIEIDQNIQKIYQMTPYGYDIFRDKELLSNLELYNEGLEEPYLATGQNGYYNEYIEENGLPCSGLLEEDWEDANFIAHTFGRVGHLRNNDTPIVYTTLLGTTEFNYATQSFPAGIYEDILGFSVDHRLPLEPLVGESEIDFYLRVLKHQIDESTTFDMQNEKEVLEKAAKLFKKLCGKKNRIYLIKMTDLLDTKASFGDVSGLRNRLFDDDEATKLVSDLESLKDLVMQCSFGEVPPPFNTQALYSNPNFACEYGIALYTKIPPEKLKYIEVDRLYTIIQKKAKEFGYKPGEVIPSGITVMTKEDPYEI